MTMCWSGGGPRCGDRSSRFPRISRARYSGCELPDEQPKEYPPRHRALCPGPDRLAVLLRPSADGKAEAGPATTAIAAAAGRAAAVGCADAASAWDGPARSRAAKRASGADRSEEHTSEL